MGWELMGGLHAKTAWIQVSAPGPLKTMSHFISLTNSNLGLLDMVIVTQLVTFRGQSFLSLEALPTAPDMTFHGGGLIHLV